MMLPRQTGQHFEQIAKQYLMQKGLDFITSNYHAKTGEIDLIFHEDSTLVFVEVRYRKNTSFGTAQETVDWQKQKKIRRTAEYFLQKHHQYRNFYCRFDVVGVNYTGNSAELTWLKAAF